MLLIFSNHNKYILPFTNIIHNFASYYNNKKVSCQKINNLIKQFNNLYNQIAFPLFYVIFYSRKTLFAHNVLHFARVINCGFFVNAQKNKPV